MEYKIVGGHSVAGGEPGDIITSDDLAGLNVDHLIESGHIEPVAPKKAGKAESTPTIEED